MNNVCQLRATSYRVAPKRGHFVLQFVTVESLTRSAPNLAQINTISFLTLPRNLFDPTLEKKWRHQKRMAITTVGLTGRVESRRLHYICFNTINKGQHVPINRY